MFHFRALIVALMLSLIFTSCGYKLDGKEEIQYHGATFRYEHYSKTTLETTLHQHSIIFSKPGQKDRAFIGGDAGDLSKFPINKNLLKGIEYVVIDTVMRKRYVNSPTETECTLYIDPAVFSLDEFHAIVDFIKSNYQRPIDENKLVQWMDSDVLGLEKGDIYFTVYAAVYQSLANLEPEYFASKDEWFRVTVSNDLMIHYGMDGTPLEGFFGYKLKGDTLFYPSYDRRSKADSLLLYKSKDGEAFGERVKAVVEYTPQ